MALTITLAYTNETKETDTIFQGTLTDQTVYGTGGNPARNTLAVYLTGEKIKQDGVTDFALTIDTYVPSTATTFTFDITKDGYHKFKFAVIKNYDNTVTYNKYDLVYLSNVVYRAIFASSFSGISPPNASYWEVISTPTSMIDNDGTATDSGNLEFKVLDKVLYPFSKVGFGNTSEDAALECCADCERGEDVKAYEMLGVLNDGMSVADQRGKPVKGEKMARKAEELIADLA